MTGNGIRITHSLSLKQPTTLIINVVIHKQEILYLINLTSDNATLLLVIACPPFFPQTNLLRCQYLRNLTIHQILLDVNVINPLDISQRISQLQPVNSHKSLSDSNTFHILTHINLINTINALNYIRLTVDNIIISTTLIAHIGI